MANAYKNDTWTISDELGLDSASDNLAKMCMEVQPPFSIAITGKWGSGKTSIMRRAFATLGGQPLEQALPLNQVKKESTPREWKKLLYSDKARATELKWTNSLQRQAKYSFYAWYSPWQHQNESNPLIPLLLEIHAQFSKYEKFKASASKINRRGGLAAIHLFEHLIDAAATLYAGKNIKVVRGLSDNIKKGWNDAEPNVMGISDGQRFHLLFEDAIDTLLDSISKTSSTKARLVIFIDDLDRCEESVVVTLLESIKLYLGSQRCVFVFGQDYSAVLGAIGRYWPERSEDDNRDYLEKLFQATIAVPLPPTAQIFDLLEAQLKHHKFKQPAICAGDIEQLIEPNPRKIKNFINSLCANWQMFGGDNVFKTQEQQQRFILMHYLRFNHREVWSILERQAWTLRLLHKILTRSSTDPILPDNLNEADQVAVKEIFSRSFTHVLQDDLSKDETDKHRLMDLEKAVDLFHQRRDRKRSDEHFIQLFKALFAADEDLPAEFLYLNNTP